MEKVSAPTTVKLIEQNPLRSLIFYWLISSALYLWAIKFPWSLGIMVPQTSIDSLIPFISATIPLYLSYFLLFPTFVLWNKNHPQFGKMFLICSGYVFVNLWICIVFPTYLETRIVESYQQEWFAYFLARFDSSYAALPSGHAGLAICISLVLQAFSGRGKLVFSAWAMLLIVTVLTTKQHFLIDLLSALIFAPLYSKIAIKIAIKDPISNKIQWLSVLAIGLEWMICILAIILSIQFWNLPVCIFSTFVIATRQHALFILYHDAVHGHLAKNRRLNDWLVNTLIGLPLLIPVHVYRPLHLEHHQKLGTGKDPERLLLYAKQHWNYKPLPKIDFLKQLLSDLLLINMFKSISAYWRIYVKTKSKLPKDMMYRESYFSAVLMLLTLFFAVVFSPKANVLKVLILFYVPYLTLLPCLEKIRSFAEHSLDAEEKWTYSWDPGIIGRLTIWPYHINFHREHHFHPQIRWFDLPKHFAANGLRPGHTLANILVQSGAHSSSGRA